MDEAAASQVGSVLGAWADEPIERFDHHHSFTANDGSPVEFSAAMSRSATEARLLFEPLDVTEDPPSPRAEGARFVARLDEVLGVDVRRFRLVEDLFAGTPQAGSFSMLGSAALRPDGSPLFKVYLNPSIEKRSARQVTGEAMQRLGLSAHWALVEKQLGDGLGAPEYEIALFALDLGDSADARVKVYLRHSDCGADQIEQVSQLARDHQPDLFSKILDRMYDMPVGGLAKEPMTCLSFQGDRQEPAAVTLYCPLDPNIVDDAESSRRVVDLLEMSGIAPERFGAIATAISGADLAGGCRLSWVSYKRPADPVVTVYAGLDGSEKI